MVLKALLLALLLLFGSGWSAPAEAHKEHAKKQAEQAKLLKQKQVQDRTVIHPMSPGVHEAVKDDLERLEEERSKSWSARSADWIGRLHPLAVHFPLALFPISWVALMLGRRRGDAEPLLRSLVVVAGASAAIAGLLGWLNGGFALADADPLLLWHRWVGTGLAVAGAAVALWTWRHRSAAHSKVMVWVLGAITAVLLVQGWLGGALVHGADHLNW
jgi:uncharacterized membrane protein